MDWATTEVDTAVNTASSEAVESLNILQILSAVLRETMLLIAARGRYAFDELAI